MSSAAQDRAAKTVIGVPPEASRQGWIAPDADGRIDLSKPGVYKVHPELGARFVSEHVAESSAATPPCPRPTGIACDVEPCWCRAETTARSSSE